MAESVREEPEAEHHLRVEKACGSLRINRNRRNNSAFRFCFDCRHLSFLRPQLVINTILVVFFMFLLVMLIALARISLQGEVTRVSRVITNVALLPPRRVFLLALDRRPSSLLTPQSPPPTLRSLLAPDRRPRSRRRATPTGCAPASRPRTSPSSPSSVSGRPWRSSLMSRFAKVYNECHEGLFSLNPILCEILNICPENNLRAGLANPRPSKLLEIFSEVEMMKMIVLMPTQMILLSLGRVGVGHMVYISGLTCALSSTNILEVSWREKEPGSLFVNLSLLPALLNSSCLHNLSPLSDLPRSTNRTHISHVRLDGIDCDSLKVSLFHNICGSVVNEHSGVLQCSFCKCACESVCVCGFQLHLTIADDSADVLAWCVGQTAVEFLQISPDEYLELPEDERAIARERNVDAKKVIVTRFYISTSIFNDVLLLIKKV
ncbi:hypothetical protein ACJX0J_012181, partial [Zea mays]